MYFLVDMCAIASLMEQKEAAKLTKFVWNVKQNLI